MRSYLLLCIVFLAACEEKPYKDEWFIFGTIVSVEIFDTTHKIATKASNAIEAKFRQLHNRWHPWQANSLLSKINQAISNGESIKLDSKAIQFLQKIQLLSKRSDYYFNPAIGHLISIWGFHNNPKNQLPKAQKIQFFIKPPLNLDSLTFTKNILNSNDKRIQIDVGAVAKGYAADLAIKILKSYQIKTAIVDVGGDLSMIGKNRPWKIGVKHPNGGIAIGIRVYGGESVVSSGDYERTYQIKHKKVHHIINPKTGYSATSIRSVTVVHKNATIADAAATAILAGGLENYQKIIKKLSLDLVLIITDKNQIKTTKKMHERIIPNTD